MSTEVTVQVTDEGAIPIPETLRRELGLKPLQTVSLRTDPEHGQLVVQLAAREEIGERIVELMSEALQGVAARDIQAGRVDDAHRR